MNLYLANVIVPGSRDLAKIGNWKQKSMEAGSILWFFEPQNKSAENHRSMYKIFNFIISSVVTPHLEKENILMDRNSKSKCDSHDPKS